MSVQKCLKSSVRRKRPEQWSNNSWILHYDNVPSHRVRILLHYLIKHQVNIIKQPPCSPDFALCDFSLFTKLKLLIRGKIFWSLEAIKKNVRKQLKAIPSSVYKKWHKGQYGIKAIQLHFKAFSKIKQFRKHRESRNCTMIGEYRT